MFIAQHPKYIFSGSKKSKQGFTLLEILIALFIFTIISIIMTRSLHTVFQNQTVTEEHATRLSQLQIATLLLSRDLEQAIDRPITNNERKIEAAFIGTSQSLTLTQGGLANPTSALARSTLQRVSYFVSKNNLVRQRWDVLDRVATSKPNAREILNRVQAIDFQYLDDENHYNDRWPAANKPKGPIFPKAVKISFELANWGSISQVYGIPGQNIEKPPA